MFFLRGGAAVFISETSYVIPTVYILQIINLFLADVVWSEVTVALFYLGNKPVVKRKPLCQ